MTPAEERGKKKRLISEDYAFIFSTIEGQRVLQDLKRTNRTGPLFREDEGWNPHAAAQRAGVRQVLEKIDFRIEEGRRKLGDSPE